MSSEEDYNDPESAQNAKKRRIQRACDMCRRKKSTSVLPVRQSDPFTAPRPQSDVCSVSTAAVPPPPRATPPMTFPPAGDGAQMPNNRCSNCVSYRLECTYVEAAKKRGPPKGYVESLETRLEKMEKLLNKLCPNADFTKELGGHFDRDGWIADRNGEPSTAAAAAVKAAYSIPTQPSPSVLASPPAGPVPSQVDSDDLDPSDDEVIAQQNIVRKLQQISVNPSAMRYHGKSSSLLFIQTAMDLKHEYAGIHLPKTIDPEAHNTLLHRHQQYWSLHPWLTSTVHDEIPPHKDFPPRDLLEKLVQLYFEHMNCYMPLLHRPTFEQGIKDGLHLHDEGFGSTVLLVCANGSRFTDDPRVLLEGHDTPQSSGWKWFQQVQMVRKSLLAPPRLYDLQIYALTASFLQGTSAPQACWTIIGIGIRMAQDVGAHRKKVYSASPTVEEELWRRAFWSLVAMDRHASFALGRPCAMQDEDFDLDLPTECDDEYWTHPDPEQAFKQPPGKPSKIAFFNCYIRLHQILAFALRTIYSINKSKALLGFVGQQWEQHIVAELDSALNKWIDSVPDHREFSWFVLPAPPGCAVLLLTSPVSVRPVTHASCSARYWTVRWDPNRQNMLFLNQSANLYAHYYQLQIAVHRPFIPSPRKPSPLSFPSLAICTNAARSCIHVLDVQYRRAGGPTFFNQMSLFTAGIVLLLNIWGGKRSGLSTDAAKEMADVHKCMKMLKQLEAHWHTAGRLWDILYELASVGDLPLPQASPAPSQKRDRDSDSPISAGPSGFADSQRPFGTTECAIVSANGGGRRLSKEGVSDGPSLASSTFAQPTRTHSRPRSTPSTPSAASDSEKLASAGADMAAASFALPVHTEELGRIPLHPGFTMGYEDWQRATRQPPVPPMAATPAPGPGPGSSRRSSSGVNLGGAPFDPQVMSMFGAQGVAGFGEMFAGHGPAAAQSADAGPAYPGAAYPPGLSTMAAPGPGAGPGAGGVQAMSAQEMAFADNTLDMWSSAPTGFEWTDWGTYVSGINNPPGAAHAPPGT
ncbi:fungal-specific transcription factor domain-containing protein [Trametes elegans]|nr:fungal-specific transcription factor domain-containing protein [Trametes elegans]